MYHREKCIKKKDNLIDYPSLTRGNFNDDKIPKTCPIKFLFIPHQFLQYILNCIDQ